MEAHEKTARAERLRYLREEIFKERKASKFAASIGLSPSHYSKAEKGDAWILDALSRLSDMGVNIKWLETGEGEPMLSSDVITIPIQEPEPKYEAPRPPVYVMDQPAFAHYMQAEMDPIFITRMPYESLPLDMQVKRNKLVVKFEVSGDSMEPNIYDKEFVFATQVEIINENDFREKISNGKVYLIGAKDYAPMVKRLYFKPKENAVLCESDNQDKELYPDFLIPIKDVRSVWYVERKYGGKFPPPKKRNERND